MCLFVCVYVDELFRSHYRLSLSLAAVSVIFIFLLPREACIPQTQTQCSANAVHMVETRGIHNPHKMLPTLVLATTPPPPSSFLLAILLFFLVMSFLLPLFPLLLCSLLLYVACVFVCDKGEGVAEGGGAGRDGADGVVLLAGPRAHAGRREGV